MKIPVNAEFSHVLAIARFLQRMLQRVDAEQGEDYSPAFRAAMKRAKNANVGMVNLALEELLGAKSPVDQATGPEMARFTEALEYGEIPQGDLTIESEEITPPPTFPAENSLSGAEFRQSDKAPPLSPLGRKNRESGLSAGSSAAVQSKQVGKLNSRSSPAAKLSRGRRQRDVASGSETASPARTPAPAPLNADEDPEKKSRRIMDEWKSTPSGPEPARARRTGWAHV